MEGPNEIIRQAREAAGLSQKQLADLLGDSVMNIYDLEAYPDEAGTVLRLKELKSLLEILHLTLPTLFEKAESGSVSERFDLHFLRQRIEQYLDAHRMSLDEFGDWVGWDITNFWNDPPSALEDWCIECLADVCHPLGLDWRLIDL